jgi:hypothetical protein
MTASHARLAAEDAKRRRFMMNHTARLMSGWMGGGIWLWTLVGVVFVVLLAVLIIPPRKK